MGIVFYAKGEQEMSKVNDKLKEVLGVEYGEAFKFKSTSGFMFQGSYMLDKKCGLMYKDNEVGEWKPYTVTINELLRMDVVRGERRWKPTKLSQCYYVPLITTPDLYLRLKYNGDDEDIQAIDEGLTFETAQEAIHEARLIIADIKKRRGL
jgi:hypothetical protein